MISRSIGLLLTLASAFGDYREDSVKTTDLPEYFAWFVKEDFSTSFISRSFKTLSDSLEAVPEFMADVRNSTSLVYISDILTHYTRENADEVLHCTAAYNGVYPDYTPGAEEYSNKSDVKEQLNKDSVLHSIGWFITPRTFGARINLNDDQRLVWNQDDNQGNPTEKNSKYNIKNDKLDQYRPNTVATFQETVIDQDDDIFGNFRPTSGNGSRAHLTLGCAPGVSAVNTGYDLVDIIRREQAPSNTIVYDLPDTIAGGGGWLRSYGEGQWVFYPKKQWLLNSTFLAYGSQDVNLSIRFSGSLLVFLSSSILALLVSFHSHQ